MVWLRDGDRNTKFFHNKASQRAKTNGIKKIKDEEGVWWRGDDHIERVLINYFDELFSSSNPSNIEDTCEVVKGKLSEDTSVGARWPTPVRRLRKLFFRCIPSKHRAQMDFLLSFIRNSGILLAGRFKTWC